MSGRLEEKYGTVALIGKGGTFIERFFGSGNKRSNLVRVPKEYHDSMKKREELKILGYETDILSDSEIQSLYTKVKMSSRYYSNELKCDKDNGDCTEKVVRSVIEKSCLQEYIVRSMSITDIMALEVMLNSCEKFRERTGKTVDEAIECIRKVTLTPKVYLQSLSLNELEDMYESVTNK